MRGGQIPALEPGEEARTVVPQRRPAAGVDGGSRIANPGIRGGWPATAQGQGRLARDCTGPFTFVAVL